MPTTALKLNKSEPVNNHGFIYSTKNYDLFSMLEGNRILNLRNLAKIEASCCKKQLIIPIIVNSDHQIIDGQHRYNVWKKLSMPIYYIVNDNYNLDDVELANTSGTVWNNADFLHKFVTQQKPEYMKFDDMMRKHKLNLVDLIKFFSFFQKQSERHVTNQFQQGKLSLDGVEMVENFLETLQIFDFFLFSKSKPFIRAFFRFYTHERFDLDRMIKQIAIREGVFKKHNTIDDYLYMLCTEVYSYGIGRNFINYDKLTKRFY
jgi:hypothetical protein